MSHAPFDHALFDHAIWLSALPFLLGAATLTWVFSLALRNVSIVEPLTRLMLFAAGVLYALGSDPRAPRLAPVLWLLAAWALWRALADIGRLGQAEHRRHRELRERHEPGFAVKSLYLVFWCRAGFAWIVSLPLLGAFASIRPWSWLDSLGISICASGFLMQVTADWQLRRFRRDAANAGQVLTRGIWRYTRHPGLFGECCLWWGFWLLALSAGAWWSVVGPALLTVLLVRASGIAGLDPQVGNRLPRYADYVLKTNAFFPGRPRK